MNHNTKYWQWMDDRYGGMGWFTEEEKWACENSPVSANGHWREVPEAERDSMIAMIGQAAYDQA